MPDKDDWRRMGQEEYLKGVKLRLSDYTPRSEHWEHEHCEFCSAKISAYPGDLHRGYCTLDKYRWICEECFRDFKDEFCWTVENKSE